MRSHFLLFLLLIGGAGRLCSAQEVYQHISSQSIYAFLDEMANEGIIDLNSVVKPYSRSLIAEKLLQVEKQSSNLNQRQQKELSFYLKDYGKEIHPDKKFDKRFDVFYYKDSLFTFSLNGIGGVQIWDNAHGRNLHYWNGAEVFAYVGKHVGIYASLRDNHEDKILVDTNDLSERPGVVYKTGQDFSEMRGGITYAWKWGSLGLVKDHLEWGNYYHYPSIISGKAPSITQLKLVMKPARWFEFNYIHGWLVSGIVDSVRSYGYTNSYGTDTREVYRKKFIAANLFTFKPFKKFYASVGNSIVYSDMDAHPAYLIPFMLYKSVDHTLINASSNTLGQNSQFFLDFSSRQIRHTHLYTTLFFDDISITRLKKNGHLDYYSINSGFQVSDLVPNTFLTFEFFQSYPLVYKHNMPTTSYESNFYNLGHYLQDNSRGYYIELGCKPLRGLDVKVYYSQAKHGSDHEELGTDRNDVVELLLKPVDWEQNRSGVKARYQVVHDVFVSAEYEYQHVRGNYRKYTAPYYWGTNHSVSIGANYGF